jgi:tripartite-type tricarboxylate transporter receptor subunit TctC
MIRRFLASLLPLTFVCAATAPLAAQDAYPTKSITVWVGFPAGGGTDILTRALAESAEKLLGQKIVVVNKPGASGTVATTELTKVKADGYTLLSNTDTPVTRSPHLRDLDYDPFRDLTPIMLYGRYKVVWAVREDSPHKTWRDVVEWAKKNPGQLTFGHPGVASTPNLVLTRIGAKEGFTFRNVPFAGDAPSITALLGGHVMMIGGSSSSFAGYVQARRMRILLVNEREGIDYAPQALTIEKAGYGVESATVLIITAPRDLPRPIAARLEKAFIDATKMEPFVGVAKKSETIIPEPLLTGTALGDYLRKLNASYEALIKEAGLYKSEKK